MQSFWPNLIFHRDQRLATSFVKILLKVLSQFVVIFSNTSTFFTHEKAVEVLAAYKRRNNVWLFGEEKFFEEEFINSQQIMSRLLRRRFFQFCFLYDSECATNLFKCASKIAAFFYCPNDRTKWLNDKAHCKNLWKENVVHILPHAFNVHRARFCGKAWPKMRQIMEMSSIPP